MDFFNRVAKNSYVTLSPDTPLPSCGADQFRWSMHVSLPFPLPSRDCVIPTAGDHQLPYELSIHNHLDRLLVVPKAQGGWPRVTLLHKNQPTPIADEGHSTIRENLQSTAILIERKLYVTPKDAFADAANKVIAGMQLLADYLAAYQRAVPYLVSWQVYPISRFDVGVVYHGVDHLCPNTGRYDLVASALTINLARQLNQPLCYVDSPTPSTEPPSPVDLSNELLAEGQFALARSLPRSAVINSYQAVETLANVVFKNLKKAQLLSAGSLEPDAESTAEQERKQHRTEASFLLHRGLDDASGRSLFREDQRKYDRILKLQGVRHQVAHRGYKPSPTEAENAHLLCCEVVQWLCGVAGFPVRPLLPDDQDLLPGLQTIANDINIRSAVTLEFLRRALNLHPPQSPAVGPILNMPT